MSTYQDHLHDSVVSMIQIIFLHLLINSNISISNFQALYISIQHFTPIPNNVENIFFRILPSIVESMWYFIILIGDTSFSTVRLPTPLY